MSNEHPTRVHPDTVRRFVRMLGFNPNDVAAVEVHPTYIEVEVYERSAADGKIAVLPGGYPAMQTVTLAVTP